MITRQTLLSTAILAAYVAAGCSYTTVPRSVPLVREPAAVPLNGVSVTLVNAERHSPPFRIPTPSGEASYFNASRKEWTRNLVESLARELAMRGASVRPGAPLTLSIAIPEIVFVETRDVYQFRVHVTVVSSRGWSRNYTGIAGVSARSVLSIDQEADRLAGLALANTVKEMLGDDALLRQFKKN